LFNLLIISTKITPEIKKLNLGLAQKGFTSSIAQNSEDVIEQIAKQTLDLVFIDMNGLPVDSEMWDLPQRVKQRKRLAVIALISPQALDSLDPDLDIDDFVVQPWEMGEVVARVRRVLRQASDASQGKVIECGDLRIDLARCEVSLSGNLVELTFREYELLKFLASNTGIVFTRDALLDKVWGYDYYGGDRAVDVYVRRVRSKVEDATHSFIETVRGVGYRFKQKSSIVK
jgi:DNA-binding response OmpR family regulator